MSGPAATIVESGGIPVTQVESGAPALSLVDSGGFAITLVDSGGTPFILEGGDDPLGPELLTNGDMSSATGWTLNDGFGLGVASIGGGVLTLEDPEGTSPNAQQLQNAVSQGATYRVAYTVVAVTGEVFARVGNSSGASRTTPGTYQEDIVCGATAALGFQLQLDNGTATIDDASVKLLS